MHPYGAAVAKMAAAILTLPLVVPCAVSRFDRPVRMSFDAARMRSISP